MRLDNKSEDSELLKLVHSPRNILFFFVLGWASFVIPFTIVLLVMDEILALLGLSVPWFLFGILLWGLSVSWSRRTEILLTSNSLEIIVDRSLFLELKWAEIEKIFVFEEEREIQIARFRLSDTATGFSIRVKGFELDKTIRLWCLGFNLRNQKKIISFLKKVCKRTNIQTSIDDTPRPIIKRGEFPCDQISQFRDALDDKKRRMKVEKAVNGGQFW